MAESICMEQQERLPPLDRARALAARLCLKVALPAWRVGVPVAAALGALEGARRALAALAAAAERAGAGVPLPSSGESLHCPLKRPN